MLGHFTIFRSAMTPPGEMHRDCECETPKVSRDPRGLAIQGPRAQANAGN